MELFDKQPGHFGRRFIAVIGCAAAAFGAPFAVNAALPSWTPPDEHVEIANEVDSNGMEYETEEVAGLDCPFDPMATGDRGWTCGKTTVVTQVVQGVDDLDVAAQRALRNAAMTNLDEVDNAVVARSGNHRIAADPDINTTAVVREIGDDSYSVTTASGPRDEVRETTAKLWTTAAGSEIPAEVSATIDEFSEKALDELADELTDQQQGGTNRG